MKRKITKKSFLQQERIIKRLFLALVLVIVIFAHFVVFNVVLGKPLTFSYASETIMFKQRITPFNPIENVDPIEPAPEEEKNNQDRNPAKHHRSFENRIITTIGDGVDLQDKKNEVMVVRSPIVNFKGNALYPNSEVFLEIHSDEFFTSVLSDSEGRWNWTNYGHPLENGEHTVEMYNFSPLEIAGKRDVFSQKYAFTVSAGQVSDNLEDLNLQNSNYKEVPDDGDLGDRLLGKSAQNVYLFNTSLLNGADFEPDGVLNLQLVFSSLTSSQSTNARINYELHNYSGNGVNSELVSQFSDVISVENDNSFLKKINLRNQVVDGKYILKISAKIGTDQYVQNVRFNVKHRPIVQIGSLTIAEDKFEHAIIMDVILITLIIITILALVALEFRRFLRHSPIDETILRKKGYFS